MAAVGNVTARYIGNFTSFVTGMRVATKSFVDQSEAIGRARTAMTGYARESRVIQGAVNIAKKEAAGLGEELKSTARQYAIQRVGLRGLSRDVQQVSTTVTEFGNASYAASRGTDRLVGSMQGLVGFAAIATGINFMRRFTMESVHAAATVETLDTVLQVMGRNAGYSIGFLRDQVDELRSSGIEFAASQKALADFLKVGMPLDRIKELSRLAQDLAVIGGTNSTESFQRILWGITTGQTDVLRTAGLNVTFESAYAKAAAAAKKSVTSLTEAEKVQARLNVVLETAGSVAGAYESALETAGKQLGSMPRLINDIKVALGQTLLPVFTSAIFATNDWLKSIRKLIEDGPLGPWLKDQAEIVARALAAISMRLKGMFESANVAKFITMFETLRDKMTGLGTLGLAGGAGAASGLLGMVPVIGRFLAPLTGFQTAVVAIIASNKSLRESVVNIIGHLARSAAVITNAMLPAIAKLSEAFDTIAPTVLNAAEAIARNIEQIAHLAAAAMGLAVPALNAVLFAFEQIGSLAALSPLFWLTKFFAQLGLSTDNARLGLVTFFFVLKQGFNFLQSALRFQALLAGLDMIQRTTQFVQGNMKAFEGVLGSVTARMKSAAITAALFTGAMMGLTFAFQAVLTHIADTERRTREFWRGVADTKGAPKAMQEMNHEMSQLFERMEGEGFKRGTSFWDALKKNALTIQDPITKISNLWSGMHLADDMRALRTVMGEVFKEMGTEAQATATNIAESAEKMKQEIVSAQETIGRLMSTSGTAADINFELLSPGMVKALEDALTQMNEKVRNWQENWLSIGQAMLDKEVETFDDLMLFYERQADRLVAFWAGLAYMQELGASPAFIQDLLQGGPEKFGGAMLDILTSATEAEAAANVARLNDLYNFQNQYNDAQKAWIVQQLVLNNDFTKQLEAEAAVQDAAYRDQVNTVQTAAQQLRGLVDAMAIMGADPSFVRDFSDALTVQLHRFNEGSGMSLQVLKHNLENVLLTLPQSFANEGVKAMNLLTAIVDNANDPVIAAHLKGSEMGAAMGNAIIGRLSSVMAALAPMVAKGGLLGTLLGGISGVVGQFIPQGKGAAQALGLGNLDEIRQALSRGQAQNLYPKAPDTSAAKDAENAQKRIDDILKNNPPIKLFGEALDELWGKQMRYMSATHGMAEASESLAKTLVDLSRSSDTPAQKQRAVEKSVMDAVKAMREEVEAAADMGLISADVSTMTEELRKRFVKLRESLPDLIDQFSGVTASARNLEETLNAVHDAVDRTLGRFLSAREATYAVEEQLDRLDQAYKDQQDLLTNNRLAEKDVRDIRRSTSRELISLVRAIQAEGKALALTGEVGADANSQYEFMVTKLKELKEEYPELAGEIGDYILQLNKVPEQIATEAKVLVQAANDALNHYEYRLAHVQPVVNTLLQVKMDAAALDNATALANNFNGLRTYDLGVERAITDQLWDQVAALLTAQSVASSGGNWIAALAGSALQWGYEQIKALREQSGYLIRIGRPFDSGGVLTPGMTLAINKTGRDEFVFTPDQVRALHSIGVTEGASFAGAQGAGGVVVEKLVVHTTQGPRRWFDEGVWRSSRGFANAGIRSTSELEDF